MYVCCQRFVWKHKEAWLLIPLSFETCEETSILKLGQLVYMMLILKSDKDWLVILHDMPGYVTSHVMAFAKRTRMEFFSAILEVILGWIVIGCVHNS